MSNKYKQPQSILKHPELIFLGGIVIGGLYRMMHWPYANRIMAASLVGFTATVLLKFLQSKKKKNFLSYLTIATLVIATVNGLIAIYYLDASPIFKYAGIVCTLIWLGLEAYNHLQKGQQFKMPFITLLKQNAFTVAMAVTGIGVLMKINHWPGAGPLIILGMMIGAVWAMSSGVKK